ncbi:MAG: hypothetical protein M3Q52_06340 [Pseudomonadota bacterium]|nr:hypothetical protein [Pseudomonadota bacterium]
MAKLETIFCVTTWGLMHALLIAAALEFASPAGRVQPAIIAHLDLAATPRA